jgi:glycosyltransferase involved in cell wall biosynthesis
VGGLLARHEALAGKLTPLVSVVMPVRNGGNYLAGAVASILGQTHDHLELLLIDDHSTDRAIASLDKGDTRLKILANHGRGIVDACNTGLHHGKGEFIARMDADDISLPERLRTQLEYLASNTAVDICGACVEIFSATGIQGGLERYREWLNSVREPEQVRQQIFIESPLPHPTLMLRRAAVQKLGGYRDHGWPEDYDLLLRADAAQMSMGKPEPVLLRWREHETRLTHVDKRYERQRFMRAKTHFLVRHRLAGRPVIIWGAGPTGRDMFDLIREEGGIVEGFIEVHPRRIGRQKRGLPVWPVDKVDDLGASMLLVAVGAAGARAEIELFLRERGMTAGEDYLFVA